MSKFKVGDRVRLLSDAWALARREKITNPAFGVRGEIGTISRPHNGGWYVDGVGKWGEGWFAEEQLEHADAKPPVAHHDRVVADTHAAIDRLVAHLERQATEHVHALDALRAEVEALRTQNAHLRALQAAGEAKQTEPKPVREVVRGKYEGRQAMCEPGNDPAKDEGRSALFYESGWFVYDGTIPRTPNRVGLTEPEAIAWVLDGVLPVR